MSELKIIPCDKPTELLFWNDLTDRERKELDHYCDTSEEKFFRYNDYIYSMGDFLISNLHFKEWDGYFPETFFSGVLVKRINEDQIMCGKYYY